MEIKVSKSSKIKNVTIKNNAIIIRVSKIIIIKNN